MGTIIQWADWVGVQEVIGQATKMVSGLTPSQAETAMGWIKVIMNDGTVRFVLNSARAIGQHSNVIQFPGTDAAQAFGDYIANGGLATAGGAAASGAAVAQSSNLTMLSGAGGTTGVGALLSMTLPTAAAAIAPLAGVALGAGLYELNPDFWEDVSRALLPWAYPDTELIPVVADEAGNTYFSEDVIGAAKKKLAVKSTTMPKADLPENLKLNLTPSTEYPYRFNYRVNKFRVDTTIMTDTGDTYANKTAIVFDKPVSVAFTGPRTQGTHWFIASSSEQFEVSAISGSPTPIFNITNGFKAEQVQIEGKLVYYIAAIFNTLYQIKSIVSNDVITKPMMLSGYNVDEVAQRELAWVMQNGSTSIYVEETSPWNGVEYPTNPKTIEVVTKIDGSNVETKTYYPISVPTGQPGVSVSPQEFPNLTENPNPYPAITPWVTPTPAPSEYPNSVPQSKPAPLPNPVPEYNPNLNPETDPSQQPAPQPDPEPAIPRPGSTGTTPSLPLPVSTPGSGYGLFNVYRLPMSSLQAFGKWLWTTFSGDIIDTVSKLFNNPMDAVIGAHEMYAPVPVNGSTLIQAGYLTSDVSAFLVANRYTEFNCGSIIVPEYYGNYLDYSPYTKCSIYLPFVGIVPVLADDIIGNSINIMYRVDTYTGCCIAIITVARENYSAAVYQFEGNCAVEIPITSGYHSALMSAMLGIAGTALAGSPHVGLSASNLGRASLGKNDVSHSGSFGASYGAMGTKIPYIIVKRPTQKSVVNYNQEYGFPAHKRVTIGSCSGYLRAREVHVISPTATDEEKARIEELLKGGVFVK